MTRFFVTTIMVAAAVLAVAPTTLAAEAQQSQPTIDVAQYAASLPINSVAPAFNVMDVKASRVLCFL
ncbi:MAG: hypothetical protein ACP5R4_09230 [Armatimonadota bacterium]